MTDFLTRFRIPDAELAAVLLQAHQGTAQTAVDAYLESHPERVRYWVTGEIAVQPGWKAEWEAVAND